MSRLRWIQVLVIVTDIAVSVGQTVNSQYRINTMKETYRSISACSRPSVSRALVQFVQNNGEDGTSYWARNYSELDDGWRWTKDNTSLLRYQESCIKEQELAHEDHDLFNNNSIEVCQMFCKNYRFIGLREPFCVCFNTTRTPQVDNGPDYCKTKCSGNEFQTCGGLHIDVKQRMDYVNIYKNDQIYPYPGVHFEPTSTDTRGRDCVYMVKEPYGNSSFRLRWYPEDCNRYHNAYCPTPTGQRPGYESEKELTWTGANAYCESRGLILMTTGDGENNFNTLQGRRKYWIGLRKWQSETSRDGSLNNIARACTVLRLRDGQVTVIKKECSVPHLSICISDAEYSTTHLPTHGWKTVERTTAAQTTHAEDAGYSTTHLPTTGWKTVERTTTTKTTHAEGPSYLIGIIVGAVVAVAAGALFVTIAIVVFLCVRRKKRADMARAQTYTSLAPQRLTYTELQISDTSYNTEHESTPDPYYNIASINQNESYDPDHEELYTEIEAEHI